MASTSIFMLISITISISICLCLLVSKQHHPHTLHPAAAGWRTTEVGIRLGLKGGLQGPVATGCCSHTHIISATDPNSDGIAQLAQRRMTTALL